jgi:hypothetical protein
VSNQGILNGVAFSRYWGTYHEGRNWLGRILELVRAELLESISSTERANHGPFC